MLWSLLRFQALRIFRSSTVATQIATTGLAALFAYIPIGGLLLLTGLGLPYVLREQGMDPVAAAEPVILPALLCAAPFVAYFHRQVRAPLPALLSRPVPRTRLANALTVVSALNISMGVLTVLVVAYWATGIAQGVALVPALAWLVCGLVVIAGFHFVCQILRLTLHRSMTAFAAAGITLVAGTLADSFTGPGWTSSGSAWLFAGVRGLDGIVIPTLFASVGCLFAVSRSWMTQMLYLDRLLGDASKRRASRDFLRDLGPVIRTDLRLLLRNSRARLVGAMFLYAPILVVMYIDLSTQPGQSYQILVAGLWVGVASVNYLGMSQRARNGFMDGLATRPVSFREMTESVLRIADGGIAMGAVIAFLTMPFIAPLSYLWLVGAIFLYVAGVVNSTASVASVLIRAPYEPQGGMFDMQGTPDGDQFIPIFLLNLGALVPLFLILFFAPDPTHGWVSAVIGGIGGAGFAARRVFLQTITGLHHERRHTLMESYREG